MKTAKIKKPLSLKFPGELVLHFIGTGSAFTKKNYQNNLIIVKGDEHLAVDFGTKASQGCYDKGLMVTDLKGFLITHIHADHVGSLEEVALMGRYFTKKAPDLIVPTVLERTLWNNALKGGLSFNENPNLELKDLFNVIHPRRSNRYPRETYQVSYKGIDLVIFKTLHIPGNATRVDDAAWASGIIIDRRIMFTADTKFDRQLLDDYSEMFDLELIIHDCQFFTGGVHASYDELKALPVRYKERMLLTHYADNWEKFEPEKDGFLGFAKPDLYYKFPVK